MSKYDKLFQSYAKFTEKLTPVEALFAITLIVVYADGKMSENESELFNQLMASGAMKGYSEADIAKISERIDRIWDRQGTEALFNGAIEALPKDMVEDALAVAAAFAIADGKVTPEESNYLEKLAEALQIPAETAPRIIAEAWENYRQLK
ncbi:tellurite resistance TerB family protein [Phormidium sp. CCY1219]|uniref:tellurite resistance TerB family protein n=1 Tax=Phormidium sp. CCY1219 TaxID=2886104 RepID=UPI002D1E61B4|nr:tellurite resistance TerB family protein [Phormidium sp. CCY1219]MEB3829681.1 tellurite resistance TerB family protein [Phormidium sp. CCY1219]